MRIVLGLFTLRLFTLLALTGLARADDAVLRVGDQRGNARALMEAAGVLADLPYRLDWSEFPAAAPLLEALNAGAIDAGGVGDAPFTFAAAAGVPVKAFVAFRNRQDGLAILVAKDSPIKTVADLRAKRIATNRGSIGHQVVLAALEEAGLPASAVTFSFLPPADAKIALVSGNVDAWSTWEPYTSTAEIAGLVRVVRDGNGITPGLSFAVASDSALKTKRVQLADFARRLVAARAWALTDPAPYAAAWSKLIGLPETVPLRWFSRAQVPHRTHRRGGHRRRAAQHRPLCPLRPDPAGARAARRRHPRHELRTAAVAVR